MIKDVPKKRKRQRASKTPYSSTKMKARNYLTNISYRRISDKDFTNANFVIDMLSYILLYVKPFFLTATYDDNEKRNMVKMLWEKCLPARFYEHIKKTDNFTILNSGKLTFNQSKNIVLAYIQQPDVWQELTKMIINRQKVYQYVFATLFPLNYLQTNKYGIKIRNDFSLCFSEWLNDKIKKDHLQKLGKNTINYVDNNEKRQPYEQKPINNNNNNANNKENIPSGYKYSPTMVERPLLNKKLLREIIKRKNSN